MKKILLAALIIVGSISAALAQATVTKHYTLSGFTAIDASFTYQVNVTKGNSDKIEVICPEEFAQYMSIKVSSGTLFLKMDYPKNWKYKSKGDDQNIKVNLQMPEISTITLSGASSLSATGDFRANVFKCNLSGASGIKNTLNISGEKFIYELSGATSAKIAGNFNDMSGHASGATTLSVNGNISRTSISVSGATKFIYNGNATDYINVDASGATSVTLTGNTPVITIDCSGAAKVKAADMITQKATASASGASAVTVYADNSLNLTTSGASSIKYYGKAQNIIKNMPKTPCSIEPGNPSAINVRIKSNSADYSPVLVILNGVEVSNADVQSLSKDDIDAISILKDKDAVAKYGSKAANGVIVITTKKSK